MKNRLPVFVFIILMLVILLPQPSLGIELEMCKSCHGYVKPLVRIANTCVICHDGSDHNDPPSKRVRDFVHGDHSRPTRLTQDRCTICHKRNDCTKCHDSHEIVKNIDKQNNELNITRNKIVALNVSNCIGCHGNLPTPLGHVDFRSALSKSKHQWMNCRTCHINNYIVGKGNDFGLHFGNLLTVPIEDSIYLCKICHIYQYKKLESGDHGTPDRKCIDCHNPHTTDFTGAKIAIGKEPSINMSTRVGAATDWITTNVPIVKNTTALFVILLIILATVGEYFLSKDEEGKKTAYNTIKIHDNEETLKTLEIKLKNQNINIVNDILTTNGVVILGMTMTKEEEYGDINTYKYVIFGNITRMIDESAMISEIIALGDVKSAKFTDKYEL